MRTKGLIYQIDSGWAVLHPALRVSARTFTWAEALALALRNFREFGF